MKNSKYIFLSCLAGFLFVLLLLFIGCSSSGSGGGVVIPTATATPTPTISISPFAGHWSGSWLDVGNSKQGTLTLTVGNDGSISGTIVDTNQNLSGSVNGTITDNGITNVTVQDLTRSCTDTGILSIGPTGHIAGVLNEFTGTTPIGSATIDLSRT